MSLDRYEKAFIIAAIQIKVDSDKKEAQRVKSKRK
jgi:hypothetical protein|nr:MAG TPA: transmemb Cytochrome C oxidase subunit II, transmembrane [Caudoviricetes sp.]